MSNWIEGLEKEVRRIIREEIERAEKRPDIKDIYNMMALIGVTAREDDLFRQDVARFIREILGEGGE